MYSHRLSTAALYFKGKPVPLDILVQFTKKWLKLESSDVDLFFQEKGHLLLLPFKNKATS